MDSKIHGSRLTDNGRGERGRRVLEKEEEGRKQRGEGMHPFCTFSCGLYLCVCMKNYLRILV